jgi:hypothetical protein
MFSDGFKDQFGGVYGKKYLSRPFQELLFRIHEHPMEIQKNYLLSDFQNWKGTLKQIDDVLVIGFRI